MSFINKIKSDIKVQNFSEHSTFLNTALIHLFTLSILEAYYDNNKQTYILVAD